MQRAGEGKVRRLPDTDADGRDSLGMSIFLLSSTMSFGGLLILYANLRGDAAWPPSAGAGATLALAIAATLVIAISSVALHGGVQAVVHARPRALPRCLAFTIALGVAFLALEVLIWLRLWHGGFALGTAQAGVFYALTGFHFLHVIVALGLLVWLVPGALRERYHARNHVRVRLVARFWHFLGVNWLLIAAALFLW